MRQPIQVAVYVVRGTGPDREYLLLRRIPSGGGFWQGGTGGVEDEESPLEAARRELREETGFEAPQLEQLEFTYTFPVPESMKQLYTGPIRELREINFLCRWSGGGDPVLDPREHDAFGWFRFAAATGQLYWPGNREALTHIHRLLSDNR